MSGKSQKRSRESLGPSSTSGPESIHYNAEGITIDKENNTESNLTPPSKRVRSDGHARNDTKMGEGAVDMELDNGRDAATGPFKSGTDTAEASQLPRKRSRKSKGDTAVTPASSTSTDPTVATAAPSPSAKDHHQKSQRYLSAAAVEAAPLISSGSVPKGGKKWIRVTKNPPVAPAARSESERHSVVAATLRSGPKAKAKANAKANAGSEPSLVNGNKGKGKARAMKARCVSDAGASSSSETLSAPAFGGAAEAESPVRGVSPSRFRRIAGSTDDLPTDNDVGRGSGKRGSRSSALKDGGRSSAIRNKKASAETYWADCLLRKVLPALGDCSAMEVLKSMVFKGVLVISLLLGSWAIWTFAIYSASRVLKGGVSYNEGGIQEGVSRRSIALSLVRKTEEYQSLIEVLESRRRELVDVRAVDETLPANLESLREGVKTLARSMQVLREQAKSIIGLPQHPDAMVVIIRSRLTEVDAMVWALKEASHATSGIIAAGKKWVDDHERNLEKDKGRLHRAADADWEKKVEPILTSAYLEVERVAAATDVLREHMRRKTGTEDVDGYIKTFESYKATATTRRDATGLQQRVEAVIAREVEMEVLGLPLLTNVDEMKHLVAREMEISYSGGTGMRDYASLAGGASVVHSNGLTSPSMISVGDGWWGYGAKVFSTRKYKSLRTAEEALSTSNVPGRCFAFKGGRGKLTVKLGEPYTSSSLKGGILPGFLRVTHVSIEHAAVANVPSSALSAPRVFVVLGWDADPAASSTFLRPHVLISRAEFSVELNAPTVQTFEVFSGGSPPPPVGWITLDVESNHGGDWTCLYGFRVHGEFIPTKGLSKAL